MDGRLKSFSWSVTDKGAFEMTAKVKTYAGKNGDVWLGRAQTPEGMIDLIRQANADFPNPVKRRVGGGTA